MCLKYSYADTSTIFHYMHAQTRTYAHRQTQARTYTYGMFYHTVYVYSSCMAYTCSIMISSLFWLGVAKGCRLLQKHANYVLKNGCRSVRRVVTGECVGQCASSLSNGGCQVVGRLVHAKTKLRCTGKTGKKFWMRSHIPMLVGMKCQCM